MYQLCGNLQRGLSVFVPSRVVTGEAGALAQGDYVVLASEGHCICGIDVAAPRHLRRGPQQPLDTYLQSFRKQFTEHEVVALTCEVASTGRASRGLQRCSS